MVVTLLQLSQWYTRHFSFFRHGAEFPYPAASEPRHRQRSVSCHQAGGETDSMSLLPFQHHRAPATFSDPVLHLVHMGTEVRDQVLHRDHSVTKVVCVGEPSATSGRQVQGTVSMNHDRVIAAQDRHQRVRRDVIPSRGMQVTVSDRRELNQKANRSSLGHASIRCAQLRILDTRRTGRG